MVRHTRATEDRRQVAVMGGKVQVATVANQQRTAALGRPLLTAETAPALRIVRNQGGQLTAPLLVALLLARGREAFMTTEVRRG